MLILLVCLVLIIAAGLSAEIVRAGFRRRLSVPVSARSETTSRPRELA